MDPTNLPVSEVLKMFGGVSAAGVLGFVVWWLLTKTIPSIQAVVTSVQADSAAQRTLFESSLSKLMERQAERDARIVDALLELKQAGAGQK